MCIRNLIVAVSVFVASCGGAGAISDDDAGLPTPSNGAEASVSTVETDELSTPHDLTSNPLVAFEASWLCQVQKRSFPSLDEMQELRLRLLAEAGLTPEAYDDFRTALDDEATLRSEVLAVFEGSCQ